ncbi:hypothetical protein SCP_1800020 [Sparassis crispa]|uniref:Uncharacterized protein n=1 Tax=Sparassis crispa TaxID=139825 RepID=A0A401H6J4_9APHY|nr:hypothetical protein SCP_1800020 [Sparassis crispa]GBE89980.1 hypothetical protein SCP_1800020 [Sparassis crispa]
MPVNLGNIHLDRYRNWELDHHFQSVAPDVIFISDIGPPLPVFISASNSYHAFDRWHHLNDRDMSHDTNSSSGFYGSLEHSAQPARNEMDYWTKNYPPAGDTTSSGGYSSSHNAWSNAVQRGRPEKDEITLDDSSQFVDSSSNGGPIVTELQDAQQGTDRAARGAFSLGEAMDPYARSSVESREEAGEMLASRYADRRRQQ